MALSMSDSKNVVLLRAAEFYKQAILMDCKRARQISLLMTSEASPATGLWPSKTLILLVC